MSFRRNLARLFRLRGSPKSASQGRDVGIWDGLWEGKSLWDNVVSYGFAFVLGQSAAGVLWVFCGTEDETHISRKCLLQSQAFNECMKKNNEDPTMCKSYLEAFDDCMSKPGGGLYCRRNQEASLSE